MKKNFFKKLSFVMALAMMISVVAPAASAFAATSPSLNSTKKYLLLGNDKRSDYNFNVNNKSKGWSYKWTSSNTNVATVNAKNGVTTAVGIGKATVKVAITKSGKAVKTLSATVIVKDNIVSLTDIYAQTKDVDLTKIPVGTDVDFGRKFVTEGGSTKKTTAVTRWEVSSDDATVDAKGVFNASKSGTYTITAVAFQSKAKYNSWVAGGKDMSSSLVLATKAIEVTVANSIESVKQISSTKFTVTFNADMSETDVKDASVLSRVISGANVTTGTEKIKSATLDSTGKILTVETYSTFTAKSVYNYTYGDLTGSFTAANVSLDEVVALTFSDFKANVNGTATDMTQYVSGVNADGVVIYDGSNSDALDVYLSFTYGGDSNGYVSGNNAYIYKAGYSAPVTVKYTKYVLDAATSSYKTITAEAAATVTGVSTAVDGATMQYAILDSAYTATTKWDAPKSIAAKDTGYRIYTRYKKTTDAATAGYTYEAYDTVADFIYESSNSDLLYITNNYLYPIAAGNVTVIVKTNTAVPQIVGTFDITIKAQRTFASAIATVGVVTVGNTALYNNSSYDNGTNAVFMVTDSLGEAFVPTASTTPVFISGPANITAYPTFGSKPQIMGADSSYKGMVIYSVYGGAGVTTGQYMYKVTLTHPATGVSKDVNFVINVIDGATASTYANAVTRWEIGLSDGARYLTDIDLKEMNNTKNLTVKVFGYNSAGIKVEQLASSEFNVVVKDATGATKYTTQTIPVIGTTGASILYPIAKGSYTVAVSVTGGFASHTSLANRTAGAVIASTSFAVTDSTTKAAALVLPVVTSGTSINLFDLVRAAYDFTLNGVAINEANITKVTYVNNGTTVAVTNPGTVMTVSGKEYYISSIEYTVHNPADLMKGIFAASETVYTYDIGKSILFK